MKHSQEGEAHAPCDADFPRRTAPRQLSTIAPRRCSFADPGPDRALRLSRNKLPVGPPSGRVVSQVAVAAPCSNRPHRGRSVHVGRTQPGQIALTRILVPFSSGARVRVNAFSAALETRYAGVPMPARCSDPSTDSRCVRTARAAWAVQPPSFAQLSAAPSIHCSARSDHKDTYMSAAGNRVQAHVSLYSPLRGLPPERRVRLIAKGIRHAFGDVRCRRLCLAPRGRA